LTDTGSPADAIAGLIAFAAIIGGVWYLVGSWERWRHERNRQYAMQMGWDYLAADPTLVDVFTSPPFGQGRQRSWTDSMRGTIRDREFIVFGYRYVTGSEENRTVHDVRVCAVRIPGHLPLVRVGPENPATRMMTAFGETDVDVESEDFDRRWRVWSRDERAAHALLTPRMIERFLEPDLVLKTITFEPGFLMTCEKGKLDLPDTPLPFDTLCDLADLVPAFLAQDYP
jgi:hypothetical protein